MTKKKKAVRESFTGVGAMGMAAMPSLFPRKRKRRRAIAERVVENLLY